MQRLPSDTTSFRHCLLRKIADIGKMSFEQNLSISCLFYTGLKANSLALRVLIVLCCGSPKYLLPCFLQKFLMFYGKKNWGHKKTVRQLIAEFIFRYFETDDF